MTIRTTVYLDENTAKKLDRYDNKSKLVKEALNMYFINGDYFISKQKVVENNIRDYEYKLDNEKYKLELIKRQIREIEKRKNNRPRDYVKSVCVLKSLSDVSEDDLKFQAEKLRVDVGEFKEWLWFDGYLDEIYNQ